MRRAGLAPLPIVEQTVVQIVAQLAVPLIVAMGLAGLAPAIAVAAPAAQPAVPVAAPVSAATPAPPVTSPAPAPIVGHGDAGRRLYTSVCAYCHHLGNDVSEVGAPGLAGAVRRYGEPWLERWLADPAGFAKDDAKARDLIAANPYGLTMPALPTMQDAQNRADIIAFLKGLEAGDAKDNPPAQ